MANVEQDLQAIMEARYGRDVRQSIHDAIRDMNVESTHAEEVAISSQSSAQNNAILAESYTKGGTGTRTGEDTDNSKYYKEFVERVAGNYTVEDSLTSTSTINALSANQGRVLDGKITTAEGHITDVINTKGVANGIASLDATGRVPSSQMPLSAMEFKGTWDASTNTPTLVQGTGTNGDFYVVSVAGTWDSTTFNVGDQLIFDADQGTTGLWVRVSGGNVISVNNQVGAVQLDADDVPFDGTGATVPLVSTDTQSAILEVLTKAGVQTYECTKAYYLAHKAELDASGKFIIVTDSGIANSAANVSFDNTGTDLANNVQGAIGNVNSKVDSSNPIDQTEGKTITLTFEIIIGYAFDTNDFRWFVPFPFVTKNTNYTVTVNLASIDNIGNVTNITSVVSKYTNGVCLKATPSIAYATVVALTSLSITILFA